MKTSRLLCSMVFCFLSWQCTSEALEWIPLHEKADTLSFEEAKKYSQEKPDSLEGQYILALVCLDKHRDNEAGAIFERILKTAPETIEAQWGKAEVLRRHHMIDESEKMFKDVIKKNPQFWPVYISLSYLSYTKKDFKKSLAFVTKVIQQHPHDVDLSTYARAHALVGGAKGMLAYYGGPISKMVHGFSMFKYLEKAQRLLPNSPHVLFGLGSFYFLSPAVIGGDPQKAKDYLEKAIQADPLLVDAHVRIAQLYKMQGDEEKCQEHIKKAQELDPKNVLLNDFLTGECEFICASIKG